MTDYRKLFEETLAQKQQMEEYYLKKIEKLEHRWADEQEIGAFLANNFERVSDLLDAEKELKGRRTPKRPTVIKDGEDIETIAARLRKGYKTQKAYTERVYYWTELKRMAKEGYFQNGWVYASFMYFWSLQLGLNITSLAKVGASSDFNS